ncbi:unnamed protein product [Dovyalis caffra]|uniref:Uncharacterized protein n=1 Tax=Dovyalis caffra TaxID=77055 RepID=A0AAV1SL03_9ROSI|nr:unnamed protein product [Dovyalis caffra]
MLDLAPNHTIITVNNLNVRNLNVLSEGRPTSNAFGQNINEHSSDSSTTPAHLVSPKTELGGRERLVRSAAKNHG